MAGFFKFVDYNKVGKGVEKGQPQKNGLMLFLELYVRKFWLLVRLNIMYFVFSIPAILIAIFVTTSLLSLFYVDAFNGMPFMEYFKKDIDFARLFTVMITFMSVFFGIVVVGPVFAGFTKILRSFSREEPAFIWSDFKDCAFANLKQSIAISLINLFSGLFIVFDIYISLYMNVTNKTAGTSLVFTVITFMILIIGLIFLMMQIYIYPMMITFKMSIKDIYKNALLFAFMRFIPNLLILIICFVIFALTFIYYLVGLILLPLITLSTVGFILTFYADRQLRKHIDKNQTQG
ncbi:MAG: hypothetical protein WC677_07910 [Clostridia bacterium]|jgi:hypothetical protein